MAGASTQSMWALDVYYRKPVSWVAKTTGDHSEGLLRVVSGKSAGATLSIHQLAIPQSCNIKCEIVHLFMSVMRPILNTIDNKIAQSVFISIIIEGFT